MINMDEKEFNLWRLGEVIAKRFRFIAGFVIIVTVIATIVAFLLPRWYVAKTLLLPPKDETLQLGLVSNLKNIISLTSGLEQPMMATPTDVYARILKSRSVAERVIEANGLKEYLKLNSIYDIREKLDERATFHVTDEGLLEIGFMDKDPDMAARVANSYAEQLDKLNREVAISRASTLREFLEKRLEEVGADLDSARIDMREFQKENKAVDLDQQTRLAMESAVGLKVNLAQFEIDLRVKEKTLSASHPEVIGLKRQINEIKGQIKTLEFGGSDSSYFNLPVANVPSLKIQFAELTARVKISETLYQLLSEQYEQAKIQSRVTAPTISVLDPAYPPEKPVKPIKSLIVLISFILSVIVAVFFAVFANYLDNLRSSAPDDYKRAEMVLTTFFGWLPGVKKSLKK